MSKTSIQALRSLPPEEAEKTKLGIAKYVMDDIIAMSGLITALELARLDLIDSNQNGAVALNGIVEGMRALNDRAMDGVELLGG